MLFKLMKKKKLMLLVAYCLFISGIAQSQINFVSNYATNEGKTDVFATEDYAYIINAQSLDILDISDIQNPVSVGTVNIPGEDGILSSSIYVIGDYAYVTSNISSYVSGLSIIDISNPITASIIGSYPLQSNIHDVYVAGSYAYLADANGLKIIDVSTPANPQLTGSVSLSWISGAVTVINDLAYVGVMFNGVEVVDISNPNAPVQVGSSSVQTNDFPTDIYEYDGKIYLTSANDGLVVFERNGTDLDYLGAIDLGYASGVYVDSDYIYMADDDFELLDAGNISAITVVDSYEPIYSYPVSSVHVAGGYIFVGLYSYGLDILELGNAVGIDDLVNASFEVFPNPSNETFTVELKAAKKLTLTVCDILGGVIFKSSYDNVAEGQKEQIVLPDVANGIYYIQLQHGEHLYTEKIIKK